jgi:hypothetical protein
VKTIFIASAVAVLIAGCVVSPARGDVAVGVDLAPVCVAYAGPVGFYNQGCGYWTGSAWDFEWFARGHGGYGHGHWDRNDHKHGHFHGKTEGKR